MSRGRRQRRRRRGDRAKDIAAAGPAAWAPAGSPFPPLCGRLPPGEASGARALPRPDSILIIYCVIYYLSCGRGTHPLRPPKRDERPRAPRRPQSGQRGERGAGPGRLGAGGRAAGAARGGGGVGGEGGRPGGLLFHCPPSQHPPALPGACVSLSGRRRR